MNLGIYKDTIDEQGPQFAEDVRSGIISNPEVIPVVWQHFISLDEYREIHGRPCIFREQYTGDSTVVFHRHFDKFKGFDHPEIQNSFNEILCEVRIDKRVDNIIDFIDRHMRDFYAETPLSEFGKGDQAQNLQRIYGEIARTKPSSFPTRIHVSPKLRTLQTFAGIFTDIIDFDGADLDYKGGPKERNIIGEISTGKKVEIIIHPQWQEVGPAIHLPGYIVNALFSPENIAAILEKTRDRKSKEWSEIRNMLQQSYSGSEIGERSMRREAISDAKRRIQNAVRSIMNNPEHTHQVIISHGEILECLLDGEKLHALSSSEEEIFRRYFRTRTGSTSILGMSGDRLTLGAYNLGTSPQLQ